MSSVYCFTQVCDNTEWKRSQKAKALKTDLQSKTPTEFKRRFQLVIPDVSVHSGHSIGEVILPIIRNLVFARRFNDSIFRINYTNYLSKFYVKEFI